MSTARRERLVARLRGLLAPTPFLNETEVRALLAAPEGPHLERKSAWHRQRPRGAPKAGAYLRRLRPRVVRHMVSENGAAFANAGGGVLLIGVNDDGTPSGHGYHAPVLIDLLETARGLAPDLAVEAQLSLVDGAEILVLRFGMSAETVRLGDRDVPYRAGDSVRHVPAELVDRSKDLQALRTEPVTISMAA